jgi:O-antigen/teichoic acid export membrane protein
MLWMFTGSSVQTVMTILVTAILARLLSPEQFGVVSASLIIINFTMIFSQTGIGPALVQKSDITTLHIRTAFTFSVFIGMITSAMIWLIAPMLENMMNITGILPVLRILCITFTFQGFSIVAEALLQKDLRFREISMIRLTSYVLGYGVVGVSLAFLSFGFWALIIGHLVQTCIQVFASIILKAHPKRFVMHKKSLKELLWFGGGHTLAKAGNYFALFGDKFVTARWLGPTALGLYERSYQFMVMPAALIGNVIQQVLFPALSKISGDQTKLLKAFTRGTSIVSLIIIPISVVSVLLAPEIIFIVLGSKWQEVTVPFQILAFGMYFRTSYKIGDSFTRSVGAVYKRAWVQWFYAFMVFGGCLGVRSWGITGISVAVLLSLFVNYVLMVNLSLKILSFSWKQYIFIHRGGLIGGAVTGLSAALALMLLHSLGSTSPVINLVVTLLIVLLITGVLVKRFPQFFLGEDGRWLIAKLFQRIQKKNLSKGKKSTQVPPLLQKAGNK